MDLLTASEIWIIIGILLFILEAVIGLGSLGVTFGLGSILTGLIIKFFSPTMIEGPIDQFLLMGALSLAVYVPIKMAFKKQNPSDINDY
jgi:membrane protein implicated in regulation of membrane protease activity